MVTSSSARPKVDMSKPRSQRPMIGLDIEEWRSGLGLSKYDAQYALGFRNSNHYNRMCLGVELPVSLELLIRLYEESPIARGWEKFSLKELFALMYGEKLEEFKGTRFETYAGVDLGTRFCKIFDRSAARQYQWLGEDAKRNENELNAYAVVECILAKLHQIDEPAQVLERVAKKVWALRGVDLDAEFRIPTPSNPPVRQKTGRKSKLPGLKVVKVKMPVKKEMAGAAKVAKKAVAQKVAPVKAPKAVKAVKPKGAGNKVDAKRARAKKA